MTDSTSNKWGRRFLKFVLLPVVLIYGWIQYNYPTATFRYKLTAEVMTPDGLKSGSSVIEVSYTSFDLFGLLVRQIGGTVTGEAVYVDLGGGKNLFVLLGADRWERKASRTPSGRTIIDGIEGGLDNDSEKQLGEGSLNVYWLPVHVFKLGRTAGKERNMQQRANALLGQAPVAVPLLNTPLMGTFGDLSSPESFRTLLPSAISKEPNQGYQLVAMTMQIVNEPVTERVKAVLPWLPSNSGEIVIRNCEASAKSFSADPCALYSGSFKLIENPDIGMF